MDFNDIEKNVLQELMERKTEVNGAGVTSSSLNSLKRFKYADANNIVYNLAKKGLITLVLKDENIKDLRIQDKRKIIKTNNKVLKRL